MSGQLPRERDGAESRAAVPRYVAALRFRLLTRFYDPILRAVLKEERLKTALVTQARLAPGQRVLDLGCGTGTRQGRRESSALRGG